METSVLLLERTIFISPESRVTFEWHNARSTLELTTWRQIKAGDLAGSWERAGTAAFRGEDIERFVSEVARQREGNFQIAPGEGFHLTYDVANHTMRVTAENRPGSFDIPIEAMARFFDEFLAYRRQISTASNTLPSSEQAGK